MQQKFSVECKASLANSPYGANRPDGSQCLANCKLTKTRAMRVARLVATRPISAGEVILLDTENTGQIYPALNRYLAY